MEQSQKTMEKLVALCKNRGFVFVFPTLFTPPCGFVDNLVLAELLAV